MQDLALRNFKRFWFAGLALLIVMLLGNSILITNAAPIGMANHQLAGDGARVDNIQLSWLRADVLIYAKISMIIDLIFIAIYSMGAICGGLLICYDKRRVMRRIGALIIAASIIFFITDYIETLSQAIQLFRMQGSDELAGFAASVGPAKKISFLVTILGLVGCLSWDKFFK